MADITLFTGLGFADAVEIEVPPGRACPIDRRRRFGERSRVTVVSG